MDPITQQTTLAAAGGKKDPLYVDDVFSTFLYTGNGSGQSLNNGIDLAGEGGLVWLKQRNTASQQLLYDTERGEGRYLQANTTNEEYNLNTNYPNYGLTSFNNNGFSLGTSWSGDNFNGGDFASWTFRKAPGFFDVVTYTGNATAGRTIAHNLGSVPGMVIIKSTSTSEPWAVWHRSLSSNSSTLRLNETDAAASNQSWFNSTDPTSSVFTVGAAGETNNTNVTYVAYIFAHDDAQYGTGGDESIIKCGSYGPGTETANGPEVNLGWEPQWLLIKEHDGDGDWYIFDNMRGVFSGGTGGDAYLRPNQSNGEYSVSSAEFLSFTSTGFKITSVYANINQSGQNYIYMAIRRPNKPPEAATDVFSVTTTTNDNNYNTTGFPVDFAIAGNTNWTYGNHISSRLQGRKVMFTNTTAAEANWLSADAWTSNTSFRMPYAGNGTNYANYAFKRAPGFVDVVAYTGTGSARGINHNLGVVPELMLVKCRSNGESWMVYANGVGPTKTLLLNNDQAASEFSNRWNGAPTSSVINLSTDSSVNYNNYTYIAYLFATLPGISKVGSYTGNGTDQTIDCGFTNGARFVMIKRTNATADWFVWDSARGIVNGNDPYFSLNKSVVEVANTDYIDPHPSGFTLTAAAATVNGMYNYSGNPYIFLAIA